MLAAVSGDLPSPDRVAVRLVGSPAPERLVSAAMGTALSARAYMSGRKSQSHALVSPSRSAV